MNFFNDGTGANRKRVLSAFPANLVQDVEVVVDFLLDNHFDIHPPLEQRVVVAGEALIIPGRVYFQDPTETTGDTLSPLQQTILNCLYLRHHNGFVRQARLERLVDSLDYFIVPFVFQLLGEYVMEILFVVDRCVNPVTLPGYIRFISDNTKYWQQTESRMISYWNEYYRALPKYRKLNHYIGKHIIDRIKANAQ